MVDFGQALIALKAGKRITREGWNARGQFVYYVPAASYPVQTGAAKEHFGEGAMVPYRAYLALKTAADDVATWVPTVSDVLAEDWLVLLKDTVMVTKVSEATIAGLQDAIAYADGDTSRGRVHLANRAELDNIARDAGCAADGVIDDIKTTLGITDEEMAFISPTVNASCSHKEAKYIGNENVGLALIYTMARIKGKTMRIVFTDHSDNEQSIPVGGV